MKDTITIALFQTALHWEDPQKNRELITKEIGTIAKATDLLIFPEMFTTGFSMEPKNVRAKERPMTLEWMHQTAKEHKIALAGSVAYETKGKYYNRLFFVTPEGGVHHYDKRHTFTLAGEDKTYASGNERTVVKFKGFRFLLQICYDLRFPVWARNTDEYDAILYVANWPKPRIVAWDTLLKARAIENMAYSIGVNRVGKDPNGHEYPGHSAVYDALGNCITFSDTPGVLYATLDRNHLYETRTSLGFLKDRDTFNLIL